MTLDPCRGQQRELGKLEEQKEPLRAKKILEKDPLMNTASFIFFHSFIYPTNIYFMPTMFQALCEIVVGKRFILLC